jgi:BirA family transcriptional regulator, biotin operon repressor / biotin---[acetyl-CoA-carboxylase] ligase
MSKLGKPLLEFDSLPSTNDLAREMAAKGAAEGTTLLAREQTAGRGRLGREWASAAGQGLYTSIILRPRVQAKRFSITTLASAVAVAETLMTGFNAPADIKWPNDVMLSNRKVCGILMETATEADLIEYAILGIGVNLGQTEFPDEIRDHATSLLIETGRQVAPEEFLSPMLERLDCWYRAAIESPGLCLTAWERLSSYARGCRVRVMSSGPEFEGITMGLTDTGALVVVLPDGERREVISGEVSVRKLKSA